MKQIVCIFLTVILFLHILFVKAQYISNPSFEGTPQMHVPPPGWGTCHYKSTANTQPGYWEVDKTPSDGNTYLGMCTRGPWGDNANLRKIVKHS